MTYAYIAGFFDGEGHVSLKCKRISISQKNPDVLKRIQKFLGYGYVRQNNQGMWLLRIGARADREDFISWISPHSIIKRDQLRQLRRL
jgi:intein-encoded DNA endonuclease-like protein